MPDLKSAKGPAKPSTTTAKQPSAPAAKPASATNAAAKPAPKPNPTTGARPTAKKSTVVDEPRNIPQPKQPRKKSATPIKLIERPKPKDGEKSFFARVAEEPELLGQIVFDRPQWFDEFSAITLLVLGLVTLLAILSGDSAASLAMQWANFIREIFGYVGAILLAAMIMIAGILIMLPRLGLIIPNLWPRIVYIEVAFFCLLALLHTFANDPEPRALARAGAGGGYIGWALSQVMISLFGSVMTMLFFGLLMLTAIGVAIGIRRPHVRRTISVTAHQMTVAADKLRTMKPPQMPRIGGASSASGQLHRVTFNNPLATNRTSTAPTSATSVERPVAAGTLMNEASTPTPLRGRPMTPIPLATAATSPSISHEVNEPDVHGLVPALTPLRPPAALATQPLPSELETDGQTDEMGLEAAKNKPVKKGKAEVQPIAERIHRYFTVEDFQETRVTLPRTGLPPVTLLSDTELNHPTEQEINANARIIENTLLEFDIDVEVVDVKVGPTVTQFAVQPFREIRDEQGSVTTQRVRVTKIAGLSNDLALALSAKRLRIQPFVPGHSYMGIEVPNREPSIVALRPVMESETFANRFKRPDPEVPNTEREIPLTVPLGRDVSGSAVVIDLATMPHLLIAGTTGSGKSVCITAITVSLLLNNMPDRVKLVLLDPKMVELMRFNGVPHLLGPVETDSERIVGVLRWATREMENRYKLLEAEGARNIESYNRALGAARKQDHMPYIVIIIDEIGDLMLSRPEETERTLARLAQMARAVGMHLVVATQRPSVDIITGLIKANFPARISFAVTSGTDSRVILDTMGAETLMGRGDMLYFPSDASAPLRVQGCYVSDPEIDGVVDWWKAWDAKQPTDQQIKNRPEWSPWERGMTRREELSQSDPMLEDAIALVVRAGEASTSMIQRQLNIPYPRAATLMDLLATLGILGATKEGGRFREVLLKPNSDQYKKLMKGKKG